MPIYEYSCNECGAVCELLVFSGKPVTCPSCNSQNLTKLMSPSAAVSGASGHRLPGPSDTGCCGSRPGEAHGCAGPGSCCGKAG